MTAEIINIRGDSDEPGAVILVSDIPGQLRQLADRIERHEVDTASVLCIVAQPGDWPDIYGWGDDLGEYGRIGLLERAKAWFVEHIATRE